jgi:hypothetical protein
MIVDVVVVVVVDAVVVDAMPADAALAARILDRIVSNSKSTFLFGPRSHCSDLYGKKCSC